MGFASEDICSQVRLGLVSVENCNIPDKQDRNASIVLCSHKTKIILEIIEACIGNCIAVDLFPFVLVVPDQYVDIEMICIRSSGSTLPIE